MNQDQATLLLAYVGGMAMLLTPCRFPVVLGIVPLCKRGSRARGVVLAMLFGLGLTITQTAWGVAIAAVGDLFGLREIARYLSLMGGVAAYLFGLWTLALLRFPTPTINAPRLQLAFAGRSEHLSALGMGLLLGNTGFCCPDPVFLSIVPFIAARGEVGHGALLAAAYGLGRATPLVAIVVLARGGADALQVVIRHKQTFDRALAWALIAIGTFTVYGYSGISHDLLFTTAMMVVPVLAYHVKHSSPLPRIAAWTLVTGVGTIVGMRLMYAVLVNLP
ncbi:MAG TPA: cytochrome c biogenesis protein CcdA [Vicinamibacterales bacterium]|jgi:cytochrome c-type biogenesis protein